MKEQLVRLLLCLGVMVAAGVRSQAADDVIRPGWGVCAKAFPPQFFDTVNLMGDEAGLTNEAAKPLPSKVPGVESTRFDLRGMLTSVGVDLPRTPQRFTIADGIMVVIGPQADVEMIDAMFTPSCCLEPIMVEVEATFAEFLTTRLSNLRGLSYDRMRALAGKSWRERESISLRTQSGQRAVGRSVNGERDDGSEPGDGQETDSRATIPMGQDGTILEYEPVIGPDGLTIDLNFVWKRVEGTGPARQERETVTSITMTDGTSSVVNLWPVSATASAPGNAPVRAQALVLHTRLVNAKGVPIRRAIADRLRTIKGEIEAKKNAGENPATANP
ncbi:MAG: hypothetical protein ABI680_02380 [Chthoniobacteraceae bacterium]